MALVGYQDDTNAPGGGYFLLRNSWGTDWANQSYYGAGYGVIPYAYIQKYCWEAFAF
jgi:C1A family cysteine protease